MAEYNGSIELIAGLKPKNNGDFPLVNAPDVLMPDGKRLSEIDFENLGGGGTMAVTFSDVTFNDDMTGSGTASHTMTEIKAAHEGGQYVYAEFDMGDGVPYYVPLMAVVPDDTGWIAVFALALGGEVLHIMVADSKEALFQMISAETGGGAAPSAPPTDVDMSRFESDGIIEETYADGTVKTTTIVYDSSGNPVKITDGDGNVTELVW